jgi:hypothetical protein
VILTSYRLLLIHPFRQLVGRRESLLEVLDFCTFALSKTPFTKFNMRVSTVIGLMAGLANQAVNAACSAPLSIDNFSKWSSNQNSLGQWTSGESGYMRGIP